MDENVTITIDRERSHFDQLLKLLQCFRAEIRGDIEQDLTSFSRLLASPAQSEYALRLRSLFLSTGSATARQH
jgi:hypothetical protein